MARYFRFYIDIPSIVIFIVLVVVFREIVIDELMVPVGNLLSVDLSKSTVGSNVAITVISNVISAFIIAGIAWFIYSTTMRNAASGEFIAFNLVADPNNPGKTIEEEWGVATILFHPFALNRNGVKIKLRLKHKDVVLEVTFR